MARLIDADLLWQEVRDDADITGRAYQAVKEHILGAKTVETWEVPDCIECQYHEHRGIQNRVWCWKMCRYMKEDGFCSEGVKMDG